MVQLNEDETMNRLLALLAFTAIAVFLLILAVEVPSICLLYTSPSPRD